MTILAEFSELVDAVRALTSAITGLKGAMVSVNCGCNVGEGADNDGGSDTSVPEPIGSYEFTAPDPIVDRKCKAANYIYVSILDWMTGVRDGNLVNLTGGSLSVMVGLLSGFILLSGLSGGLLIAVAGALISIALIIITTQLDMTQVVTELVANQNDLICALYNATSATQAKIDFGAVLDGTSLGSGEKDFILLFMPNSVLSLLFGETENSAAFFDGYEVLQSCDCLTNECVLFRMSQVSPFNTMEIGTVIGQTGGVTSSAADGWYFPTTNDYIDIEVETAGLALVADTYQQYRATGEQKLGSAPKNATMRFSFINTYYDQAIPNNLTHEVLTQNYPQQAGSFFAGALNKDHVLLAGAIPPTIYYRIRGGTDGVSYLRKLELKLYDADIPGCEP